MSLQVRLRHALGERLVDLPERSVEEPVTVGRAKDADLKVPSVTLGNQHCALFVHEGQWAVQDLSDGATLVNGAAINGVSPLCVGDVIGLGTAANSPTIIIDPAGAAEGRTGHPAVGQVVEQAPARRSSAGVPKPPSAAQTGAFYGMVAPPPPQPRSAATQSTSNPNDPFGGPPPSDDPFGEWSNAASGPASAASAPRRKKPARQTSDAGMIFGIMMVVAIVGVTLWFAYKQSHRPPSAAPPPVAQAPVDTGPKNIFTNDGSTAAPAPKPAPAAAPMRTPRVAPAPPPKADADPSPAPADANGSATPDAAAPKEEKTDSTLDDIEGAHYSSDYGRAILKFDDYRRQHPGAFADRIDAYTAEALDRLWCKRIAQLCKRRVSLNKLLRTADTEIRQETSASFKKELQAKKADAERDLSLVEDHLTNEMGYTSHDVPDPTDAETFGKLTTDRDPMKFSAWKIRTLKFIRQNHGSLPWDGEAE